MNQALQQRMSALGAALKLFRGRRVILIDDPPVLQPRYGHGRPPHAALLEKVEAGREGYRALLAGLLAYIDDYRRIARGPDDPRRSAAEPCWLNGWLPGLDAAALYGLVAQTEPNRYVEVGSGFSTMFARQAIVDHGLSTRIVSIDPKPRAEIDAICDEMHRVPLEALDVNVLAALEAGDILFVDSSHRVFMNSDVQALFMDVLPNLRPGVLIHFHDIWLPLDYPARWAERCYSEQYMLAAVLLFGDAYEIVLPNRFITEDAELSAMLAPLWERAELKDVPHHGGSFWIRRR